MQILDSRKLSMAIVRPYRPNLAEMSIYRLFLDLFDVTFYFTGIELGECRTQLDAMGLQSMRAVRYAGYPDIISSNLLQRFLDYKVGFGSHMLSHLQDVLAHDYINIVDPIYSFTFQIARALRPTQKLIMVRWENIYGRYDKVWRAGRYADDVLSRSNRIICVSKASLHTLRLPEGFSGRISQVYPGIDLAGIQASRLPGDTGDWNPSHPEGAPVILFVGRLQWTKGLHTLLVALSILRTHMALLCRLWVVGGGNVAPFREVARELGLEGQVEFLGSLSNSQVRHKMQEADVFCLTSLVTPNWMEQFGFALVEAMAHGLPVVASDSGSIREICGEDALYASMGNSYSLAEKIAILVRDPAGAVLRGQRLRDRALREFDADQQGKKMLEAIS